MVKTPDPRLPVHAQVRDELMRRIASRVWKPGEALPGEGRLAEEFGISVGTMRKAIQALVQEGALERTHGKGTFVSRAYERSSMLRFVRFQQNGKEELPVATILKVDVRPGPGPVRERLAVGSQEKLLYVHRTRSHDGEVILVEHIWLPHKKFRKLEGYLADHSPPLLYPVYDAICNISVSNAIDELSVSTLTTADAALFRAKAGAMCMQIERTMYDHMGGPVEWRVSYVTVERFHYTVEIR